MRLINRLERQQHDPDDGPQETAGQPSVPKPDEIWGEETPEGGAEAMTGWEQTPRSDPGGRPRGAARSEWGIGGSASVLTCPEI